MNHSVLMGPSGNVLYFYTLLDHRYELGECFQGAHPEEGHININCLAVWLTRVGFNFLLKKILLLSRIFLIIGLGL